MKKLMMEVDKKALLELCQAVGVGTIQELTESISKLKAELAVLKEVNARLQHLVRDSVQSECAATEECAKWKRRAWKLVREREREGTRRAK